MDIAAWLRELGLERYEAAFRKNDIALDVLPELTDQDLKELGVSLGHRRLLLKAIRALAGNQAGYASTEMAPLPSTASQPAPHSAVERRQLTVLFCDLKGSTELAARLAPEDLGAVMSAYQTTTAAVIERFGGYFARYLGDGVLAYFGWPRAHEDDAERAVRAGLELIEAVARLRPHEGVRLQARVGIATGQVVVGDLVGEGAARDDAVVGETPNLAARLQALAAPEGVVISQSTRRLMGGLFELTDLGPQRLKGFAEPLAVWRVSGEGSAEGRFEARQTAGLTFEPLTLSNYGQALSPVFLQVFWITLRTAGLGTLACLLVGFPVAYALATRVPQRLRPWLLFCLILPYWISFLLRTFAWRIILAPEGALSGFLQTSGILDSPLAILDTQAAVQLGIIYNYLPVAILPIFVALDRIDPELRRASMDLGAGRIATFLQITLPLAAPGIVAAALLTFVLAAGDYVVPAILGGARGLMIGTLIAIQILGAQDLPLGAAMAVTLIAMLAVGGALLATLIMLMKLVVRAMRGPAI